MLQLIGCIILKHDANTRVEATKAVNTMCLRPLLFAAGLGLEPR